MMEYENLLALYTGIFNLLSIRPAVKHISTEPEFNRNIVPAFSSTLRKITCLAFARLIVFLDSYFNFHTASFQINGRLNLSQILEH